MAKPTFEHRHYKAIAALMASLVPEHIVISAMADAFAKDNNRFDRARFLAACEGRPINGRDKVR